MKSLIHIYLDDYETDIKLIKRNDIKIIIDELFTFIKKEGYVFEINFEKYIDPIATRVPEEFMKKYNKNKITLEPFGFHKGLKIMFEYVSDDNKICDCGNIYCDGDCGTLICGCVDICRGKCGDSYDSY